MVNLNLINSYLEIMENIGLTVTGYTVSKERGEWSHTHQIAYRANSFGFHTGISAGDKFVERKLILSFAQGYDALQDVFLMLNSYYILSSLLLWHILTGVLLKSD